MNLEGKTNQSGQKFNGTAFKLFLKHEGTAMDLRRF